MEIVLISPEHTLNNSNSSANEQKDICNPHRATWRTSLSHSEFPLLITEHFKDLV